MKISNAGTVKDMSHLLNEYADRSEQSSKVDLEELWLQACTVAASAIAMLSWHK